MHLIHNLCLDFDLGIFYETPENGLFEVTWPKGNLRYQWYYKDGLKADGVSKGWHPNGNIKHIAYWKDGKQLGIATSFHEDGRIKSSETLKSRDLTIEEHLKFLKIHIKEIENEIK